MAVQKSIMSQSKTSTPCSSPNPKPCSAPTSSKKRRAPPPPSDQESSTPSTRPARPPLPAPVRPPPLPPVSCQEKENSSICTSRPATRSKTGRPSLDAKFSAIIQQLQRNNNGGNGALGRKNAPLGVLDVQPQGQAQPRLQQQDNRNPHTEIPETTGFDHGFVRSSHVPGPVPAPRSKLRKSFRERMNFKALWSRPPTFNQLAAKNNNWN